MRINSFRFLGALVICALHGTSFAQSEPRSWLQGIWNGKCERGGKAINAQLVLAYKSSSDSTSGSLNGRGLTALTINGDTISFAEGTKNFTGTFDASFNNLSAELDKGPKADSCQLRRTIKESDLLCLLGSATKDGYVWLNSPNGSGGGATFILRAGQHLEVRGDRTGVLCTSSKDFKPPTCPVSVPQKYYSCQ